MRPWRNHAEHDNILLVLLVVVFSFLIDWISINSCCKIAEWKWVVIYGMKMDLMCRAKPFLMEIIRNYNRIWQFYVYTGYPRRFHTELTLGTNELEWTLHWFITNNMCIVTRHSFDSKAKAWFRCNKILMCCNWNFAKFGQKSSLYCKKALWNTLYLISLLFRITWMTIRFFVNRIINDTR